MYNNNSKWKYTSYDYKTIILEMNTIDRIIINKKYIALYFSNGFDVRKEDKNNFHNISMHTGEAVVYLYDAKVDFDFNNVFKNICIKTITPDIKLNEHNIYKVHDIVYNLDIDIVTILGMCGEELVDSNLSFKCSRVEFSWNEFECESWFENKNNMLINERVLLNGNIHEKVQTMLGMAGFYKGRNVDIANIEKFYKKHNIELFQAAREFYKKYYGLATKWYLDIEDGIKYPYYAADFEFKIYPHSFRENELSVRKVANEDVLLVGTVGYYYPLEIYISRSGKIYAESGYGLLIHSSLEEMIEDNLSRKKLESVMIML
ncbi:SUKH-3 immunity protein [Clostridium cavendishii DSM 21758]|uniref:SUKH-3 immunity protein n=1 Tax=Clostridium cavendishii DSM 21758 TaxID=1121302 RepID=A0A1M6GIY2_9CLOT|nr:SUKH-3 domain-containing protein [Clostridium cavendishii]SHJ09840.1 SUKH-3 immunity protein [Clostridium cavendishii DSM 21758]